MCPKEGSCSSCAYTVSDSDPEKVPSRAESPVIDLVKCPICCDMCSKEEMLFCDNRQEPHSICPDCLLHTIKNLDPNGVSLVFKSNFIIMTNIIFINYRKISM